jgi:hypothetical protein
MTRFPGVIADRKAIRFPVGGFEMAGYGLGFRRSPGWETITAVPGETRLQKMERWRYERRRSKAHRALMKRIADAQHLTPEALQPRLVRPQPAALSYDRTVA